MAQSDKIGIFSFFSGAGFLDLAFDLNDSFEVLFVNELFEPFMNAYQSSRKELGIRKPLYGFYNTDITDFSSGKQSSYLKDCMINAKSKFKAVGFVGGPPCPDFSVAGKNRGEHGKNGKLSDTYTDLIVKNQPDFFMFENVKGLYTTKKHRAFFESMKTKLKNGGYELSEKLINSLEYGVPQDRERIILVGFSSKYIKSACRMLGNAEALSGFDWNIGKRYEKNAISAKKWPRQSQFHVDSSVPCPRNIIKDITVEHWFKKNQVEVHPNAKHHFKPKAGLPKFKKIPEGDDLKKSYKRLHRWRYSPTVAYGNNEVHLHPYKARRLSVAEALALQSMPKEFSIPDDMTLTNMFKTVGNGVPFLVASGLAGSIRSFIDSLQRKG